MKYSNTVEYNISTKLDASGLTKMQAEIQKIELMLQKNANRGLLSSGEVEKARTQLENLGTALTKAFDPSLGTLNLEKLQTSLKGTEFTAEGLSKAFKLAGTEGELAFNNLVGQLGRLDTGLTQSNSALDKMFTTFSNTFRWGLVSSFFSQFMNAIHSSVDYVKELDDSLTQIMLVTDYNRDSMNEFARSANEAAKAVSMTTTGMTNASLIFAQQGYGLEQSQELATLSAKLANASQQDTATTSDQITAYMNAYGLENSIGELTQAMDNWALIANISAADVGELAQASQRAASMANTVGVSGEQLAAQIATIESVTREAPEQIGNGLKTLYARFSDISAGGEDEEGVSLGDVTKQLNDIGVRVLDQFGNIRDVGDIMEDLMFIWDDLDQTSKIAAAQSLAGKYQVNRFVSLMDNSDMYREYLGATGSSATGTLDQMNEEYAESLAGRTQKLQATLEGIFNNLFSTDDFYAFIDVAQKALEAVDNLTEAMGGGIPILTALSGLFLQLFSKNISQEMIRGYQNNQLNEIRQQNAQNVQATISQLGLQNAPSKASQNIVSYVQQGAANYDSMSENQIKTYNSLLEDQIQAANQAALANKELANKILEVGAAVGIGLGEKDSIFTGDRGEINTSNLLDVLNSAGKEDFSAINPDDFKEASQEAENLAKSITIAMDTLAAFSTSTDANSEELIDLSQKLDLVKDHLIQLHDAGAISDETFNRMSQTVDSAKTSIIEWDGDLDKITDDLLDLGIEATDLASILQGLSSGQIKWDNLDSSIQSAILQLKAAKDLVQNTNNLGLGFLKGIDTQKQIQGLLDVIGAVTRLASAYMTFQNLGSIWKNENISKGEKVLQTIMAIGTIVPTVIDSFNKLKNSIPKLIALQNSLTVASTATATAEAGVGISAKLAASGMGAAAAAAGALGTALKFLTGPWGILLTALSALASFAWNQYVEDIEAANEKASKVFDELMDQTAETANKLNETAPALNELYDAYKQTGKASDEFKQSLESQAELLGINDAALLISQGKYDDLKTKIDEATEAIYNNNAALQQVRLNKINPNEMVNELTDDQKERYNVTYHQEEGITGISGGTATKGQVNKLDQTPYELVKAAQQDIETQQEKINSLTQERNNLVKEGLTATGEASQKIASDIARVDEELTAAAQKLAESKEFTENHSDILEATNTIRDNALNQELNNSNSIFKTGTYEEIKNFISAQEGVDSSNINELIQKYADLTGNIDAATEATLRLRDQQIKNNELVTDDQTGIQYRAGEKGKFLIDEIGKQQDWSDEDKAKISNMIDWSDPDVDQKVIELLERIQQGLNDGLSLDEALKIQNPEDIKAAISEMEPIDSDLDVGPYREMAEYLREFAGELEGIPEQVGQNSEMLQDFTEAILRYDDAIQDADENLNDWKDLLLNTAEAAEDDAVYLEDLMEAFEGMRDMIGDLLDMDVSDLSQQFMQNSDVLDILDKAIYGVGEEADLAYDQLNYLAQLDMAGLIDWTDGIDEELAAWDNALPSLEANMDSLSARAAELGDNASYAMGIVQDVLGGSIPGPDLDLSAFIAGLEQMVNDGEMSVAQAMAAIDGAGYSAEVTQGEAEGTNTESHIDATPEETPGVSINSQITGTVTSNATGPAALQQALSGSGTTTVSWQGNVPGIKWNMTPAEESTDVKANATGVKYKANTGGGGGAGQIHFTNVKAKPSGSTKRNASGNGNHSRPSSGGRGSGGGKGSCFVAGTLITTQTSFKPIEQIQKGDIVLSYNEQIGFNQYSKVVQTMIHDTIEPIYTLYIKNEQLRVTGIHRFFVTDKITCGIPQWVCAADLHVGQWVLFADGTWHVIHKIKINIEHQTVYNFEVSGNHNYYVGRNQILAHNKGGGGGGKGSTPKTIEPKEKKDHQKDYYEEVKNQLSKTEKVLSKIEKEEDRLIGDEARANQNRQIKFLEKEIKLNEKKLKINKQELKDIDDKIKKEIELAKAQAGQYGVNANIPEVKYDEDGVISNYEEISAAIDRIHNELIDKYNAAAAASNEELTKEIQKAIDKFDKYGDNVLKNAQRHNALQSEIEETKNTLEELQDAIEDIRIEAKHAAMEAIDDIKDLNKSMAELDGFFSGFKLDSAKRDLTELGSELDSVFNNDNAVNYYNNLIAEQDKMIEKAKEAVKTAKDAEEKEKAQALLESRTLTRNALIEQRDRAQNALNSGQEWKGGILGLQQQHVEDLTKRLEAFNNAELNGKEYVDPIFGKNKAALMEYLEEARSGLADTLIQVEKLVEDFRSSLIDLYDESADKQQKLQDEFDRQTEKLETRMDWYTLYYGDEAYDAMNQFYTKEGELLAAQSRRRKADADFWYAEAEKLRIKSQQQGIELDKEQYDHLLDLAKEAESESEELATKSAEAFKDAFDKAIDAVGQKFYRTIFSNINRDVNGAPEAFANSVFNNNRIYDTSYLGITDNNGNPITQASLTDFNDIKTKWELQKDYSSKYRDNMERSYEIDKLRAKYMDILNNAQNMSLQTQNKIRAQMQDQLDYLKGQTTLSEYDVKLANARLEILQKQIALEEAQRNKNKMQLRRDTQGNYRYVYTADKGDTDKAQQELDDSLFDAYEITKEQSLQNVDSLLSSLQNYMEQRSEILRRYSANDAETAQKRAAALAMLDEEYKQIWTALGEDFSDTMQGLDEVLTWTIENGNANTVEAASEMLDAVNNHNYDILGEMNASWIGWSDDMRFNVLPAISEATQEAMIESEVAVRDFAEHLVGPEGILPELNSGINSYKDILDKTKQSTNELAKASEELATALNADSIEFQKKTEQLLGYQQELNNTKNTTSKLRDELNKARELLEKEKKKTAALTQGIKDIAAGTAVAGADGSVKGKSKPGGSGTKNTGKWHVGDRVGFHGWYNYTSWGQEPAGNLWSDQKNAVVISDFSDISVGGTQSTGEYTIHLETPQGGWLGWVRPDQLFDTGGYTGQWSDGDKNAKNGKWAMLHEKELVLNANDTENILQAVNMLRKFTNALGISKLSLNGLTTNQGQIEQRVEINASFPNVHSAEDVEAALLEIADQAYIYAHKD